jgi:hypothetical protein
VREAVTADLSDFFSFLVGKATSDLEGAPYGGARYPVEAVLGGRTFARFHLDIGVGDLVMEPVERTREAVARTFARRGTHPIPPALQPASEDWAEPFSALAVECGLDTDLNLAFKTVDDFYRTLQEEGDFRDDPR